MSEQAWRHMDVDKPLVGQAIEWPSPIDAGLDRGVYQEDGWCTPIGDEPWAKCKPVRWRPVEREVSQ